MHLLALSRSLNGWHRLALLLSLVWAAAVGYWTLATVPASKDCFFKIGSSSCIMRKCLGPEMRQSIEFAAPNLAAFSSERQPCDSVWDEIAASGKKDEVLTHYAALLDKRRAAHYTQAIMATALPMLAMYLLGYAVAWVRKGFRKDGDA